MTLNSRITYIWIVLILATFLSWQFGHGFGFGEDYRSATTAILVITFIKIRFVFLDFMELRAAPLPLRLAFETWGIGMCAILVGLYWTGA
ncbi:MAG: cytochrome C oxidase subunit IV family protein [Pseudomonadota bacterium]